MNDHSGRSRRKTLTQTVEDELVALINSDTYKPGDKLPNELELSAKLGVARGTLREAVKLLVSRNILEIRRGNGTFVSQYPSYNEDPWGLAAVEDKFPVAVQLLELRGLVEPPLAEMAAVNATSGQLDELAETCEKVITALRKRERRRPLELKFHLLVMKASGNNISEQVLHDLISQSLHLQHVLAGGPERGNREGVAETYRLLNEALQGGNAAAAGEAMKKQLKCCLDDLVFYRSHS